MGNMTFNSSTRKCISQGLRHHCMGDQVWQRRPFTILSQRRVGSAKYKILLLLANEWVVFFPSHHWNSWSKTLAEVVRLHKGCCDKFPHLRMRLDEELWAVQSLMVWWWCAFSGPRYLKSVFMSEYLPNLKKVCFPDLALPAKGTDCLRMYKVKCNSSPAVRSCQRQRRPQLLLNCA